ncbi:MAG: bifunctional phosphopantothenoylcysteine decarboxylase/phosphopantothenate--cysteine ligase CoaBC [Armatimonadetes bacterium]|nr:bifunctional phosphopantothenoylcysteine decarboxylase/phosphopantothenate--cysteine ligase CoaBC [Armatimonadota bacterium]
MKPVVILGVTGSVAAYRAADVTRELMRNGFEVRVCLSRAASEFVTPALFEALTGGPCLTNVFDEPVRGRMAHIDWARDADAILVCPATANAIAIFAHGQADDMISTIASASSAELVIAPAMNPEMYASKANQENLRTLAVRGALIVDPETGEAACGESGQGKLARTADIVAAVKRAAFRNRLYKGKHVLVTAGPTYEALDPVRFIGNRSSGKMGYALAEAALRMGADVTLVSGPAHVQPPPAARFVQVMTACEMLDAVLDAASRADLLIGAAAVADYRPEQPALEKIKRGEDLQLRLIENPDILVETHSRFPSLPVVGFAAETENLLDNARTKMELKGLLAIAVNDVARDDVGFDSDDNELTLLFCDGESVEIPKGSKFNVAVQLLELIKDRIGPIV